VRAKAREGGRCKGERRGVANHRERTLFPAELQKRSGVKGTDRGAPFAASSPSEKERLGEITHHPYQKE